MILFEYFMNFAYLCSLQICCARDNHSVLDNWIPPKTELDSTKTITLTSENVNNEVEDKDDGNENFQFMITGGYRPIKPKLSKYLVSLRKEHSDRKVFGGGHHCCGTIIQRRIILTAAHCIMRSNKDMFIVVAGTKFRLQRKNSTQVMAIEKVQRHERYNSYTLVNDIAILKLTANLKIDKVSTDILPIADTEPMRSTKCHILGWGSIIQDGPLPDEIVYADLEIIKDSDCTSYILKRGMFCALNPDASVADACTGDSGAPLICDGKMYGIVSYGAGCGRQGGVYTNVYYYRKWIEKKMASSAYRLFRSNLLYTYLIVNVIIRIVRQYIRIQINLLLF